MVTRGSECPGRGTHAGRHKGKADLATQRLKGDHREEHSLIRDKSLS